MPSPRSPRLAKANRAGLALAALLLAGCASGPSRAPAPDPGRAELTLPRQERAFLVDPLAGYPSVLDDVRTRQLQTAFREMLEGGRVAAALETALGLLAVDPTLHPAALLAAQADFAAGRLTDSAARLRPLAGELPAYAAVQLLLGRVAETLGELPEAYAAYLAVGDALPLAAERAAALLPRTLEILANRVDDALARDRTEAAEAQLALLRAWAPEETLTLEAARRVAVAGGDLRSELAAVRRLATRAAGSEGLVERQAYLEVEVGDVKQGLDLYRQLLSERPQDSRLADQLEKATFRYRLELLPEEVRAISAAAELTRGQYAALLYWLVPEVRRGRATGARIAVDIHDHPQREAIARVANLGLMEVDATVHRFEPERALTRWQALAASLAILASTGSPPACADGVSARSPAETVCTAAAGCGLIPEAATCRPTATLSGDEAVELIRRTLSHE